MITLSEQMLKQEVARSQQQQVNGAFKDGLSSGAWNELFVRVTNQLEAVHSSALRISSSAESLGAVEYEARLSAAVQVLILYVDHIKVSRRIFFGTAVQLNAFDAVVQRKWEREHHELEETKRILKESGVNVAQCLASLPDRQQQQQQQQGSGPVSKRRASFPAAPLRRISLRTPPSRVSLLQDSGPIVDLSISATPIAEEREDGEEQPPKSPLTVKKEAAKPAQKPATPTESKATEANNNESSNNKNEDEENSAGKLQGTPPGAPVTTRRKG